MKSLSLFSRLLQVSLILLIFLSPLLIDNSNISDGTRVRNSNVASEEPLSIILMIGDGMGYEHVELARLVELGESGSLTMQQLMWNSTALTFSANAEITDSAAAGTALATGSKTNNGYLSVTPSNQPLETILEYAQTLNKSTGVVSTALLYHATPASFMTHINDRNQYTQIAQQIVENANVDVLLGGGNTVFSYGSFKTTMQGNGYSIVYNRTDLLAHSSGKLLGLFADSHMSYEQNRNITTEPSLLEMTNKSIELLSQDPDGFFLMVEGAKIDLASHDNNKVDTVLDTIAFNEAVCVALEYVENHNNTILLVTADHECGGLAVVSSNLNSELPQDLSSELEKRTLRIERASNVSVTWSSDYHTADSVPVYCYGSVFDDLPEDTLIDNTEIFDIMKDFYDGVTPLTIATTTMPTSATSSTTLTTTTTTTTSEFPFDPLMLVIIGVGVAVVVIIVIFIIRKR